jgi:hypothetical protein
MLHDRRVYLFLAAMWRPPVRNFSGGIVGAIAVNSGNLRDGLARDCDAELQ